MAVQRKSTPVLSDARAVVARAKQWVDRYCQGHYWKFWLSILCVAMVLFVAFPSIENLSDSNDKFSTWSIVKQQIESPLTPHEISDHESHNAKRTFRLAVPVLFKLLNVHYVWLMYVVQLGISLLFFWIAASLAEQDSQNRTLAFTLSLSFAFVYMGQVGITDTMAKFDVYAITCMLSAMYFRRGLATFLLLTFALWTDERAIAGCGLVYIYFKIQEESLEHLKLLTLIKPGWNSYAVVAALIAYFSLRLALTHYFGFKTVVGNIGPAYLFAQMNMLTFGLWSAFEGFWLLILVSLICLWKQSKHGLLLVIMVFASIQVTTSFFVVDITRSLIYMAPLVFIALNVTARQESPRDLEMLCFLILLICALVPTYFAEGGFRIEGSNPLMLKLLRWIT